MRGVEAPRRLTLPELETVLAEIEPAVLLVSPRLLRRVIRQDRRIGALGFNVPHGFAYHLPQDRLFDCVSRFELDLDAARRLPENVLLIQRPEDEDLQSRQPGSILREYWRLLFHIRVHQLLERRVVSGRLVEDAVLQRLRGIGSTQFAEIREVLQRDEVLLPPHTETAIYIEFAATFLELYYFAPGQLTWHFPALIDHQQIADLLAQDLDHAALQEATRLPGAAGELVDGQEDEDRASDWARQTALLEDADPLRPSPPAYLRLAARAEKASQQGNAVKAAILRRRASRLSLPDGAAETIALAQAELERLAVRMQAALDLSDEHCRQWAVALEPLLARADQGFRTAESRVLYDLQKVCVEAERGLYRFELFRWVRSLAHRPLRRQLPLLSDVMAVKHLRGAASKLAASHLPGEARARLTQLIELAVAQAQRRLRDKVRPLISETMQAEGLRPANVPEQVAFHKIVGELLDRIVRQGYLSLGHLRDALSKNNLKLPDLTSLWELVRGDLLLRIDRRLAAALPGVYYRGPVYLRWSHQISALAFGTGFGRLLMRYVAFPYAGAFLLVEFGRHVKHMMHDPHSAPEVQAIERVAAQLPPEVRGPGPDWQTLVWALLLGTFLLLLINWDGFRHSCLAALRRLGQLVRGLIYDLPLALMNLPWVRRFFDSMFYGVLINYGLKPALFTAGLMLPFQLVLGKFEWSSWCITFLALNLAINSPLGRYLDQLLTEQLVRGWRELRIRVFAATFQWIMDSFHYLLHGLERVAYTVDEWLRFRAGDRRSAVFIKFLGSSIWSVVSYVTMFVFTLLLEPQINPIKHFPVVTVSHKLLIPSGPIFVRELTPYLDAAWANTIVWSTIWMVPGVFGFLVWELKENWRLYASNRARYLKPVPIGRHGEPMLRLLRRGIHSGTLPRLFGRLRNAAHNAARYSPRSRARKAFHKHLEGLRGVEESVRHFLDRELVTLLAESCRWDSPRLSVGRIQLATNQILAEILHPAAEGDSLQIAFQQRAGLVLVSLQRRGWLDAIPADQQQVFGNALLGLYHLADVDLVSEQLAAQLGPGWTWYDLTSDGLLVWRDARYTSAELYPLRETAPTASWTALPYEVKELPPAERDQLFFSRSRLAWDHWVELWTPAASGTADSNARETTPSPRYSGEKAGVRGDMENGEVIS